MSAATAETETSDLLDDAQGAFFELPTLADLEPYGGPYSNAGEPKTLRAQCVECNRRFVRLGALRCDGCLHDLKDAGSEVQS